MPEEILAKGNPPISLRQHTLDCLSVFRSMQKSFPHVKEVCNVERFFEHLFYAVWFHDIGKVAKGFQSQLYDGGSWGYRHEILSAGFIWCLNSLDEVTKRAIALAIITHHKNIDELRKRFNTTLPIGKEQFQQRTRELSEHFGFIQDMLRDIPALAERYLGHKVADVHIPDSYNEVVDVYERAVRWYVACQEDGELTLLHSTIMVSCFVVS